MNTVRLLALAATLAAFTLQAVEPGQRAPGFALPDAQLQVYDLYDYHGKIVLIELMQTTCPHCAAFASVLHKVQEQYAGKVQILAVANSSQDNAGTVAQYIAGHQITYPVLFDAGQMAYSYARVPHFDLPQLYVIDAKGMVQRHYEYGPMSRDIFEGDALLKELDRMLGAGAATKKK
jgi:peroxiredoxin